MMEYLNLLLIPSYSYAYKLNYLPTHMLGVAAVSQTDNTGSVVQSPSTWHSSAEGAKVKIG